MQPIAGRRFECQSCAAGPDNDLCENCYRKHEAGMRLHPRSGIHVANPIVGHHVFRPFDGKPVNQVEHWLTVPDTDALSPLLPERFLIRPEFCSGPDSYFGAYAFAIQLASGVRLLLTALHVMDELVKAKNLDCSVTNMSYSGNEIPAILTQVNLYDVLAPNWIFADVGHAYVMLILPQARIGEEEPYAHRDIAAFKLAPGDCLSPAKLATRSPNVGESLWLVVKGSGTAARTARAVVVEVTDKTFVFRFAAIFDLPPHTSGAPLVNECGEIVGINVGGGFLNGRRMGHGMHVVNIHNHLALSPDLSGTSENI